MAKRATNLTAAGTYVLAQARHLYHLGINQGAASATVELQVEGQTLGTIDAANADIGRHYDLELPNVGLTVILVGAPDITVIYD